RVGLREVTHGTFPKQRACERFPLESGVMHTVPCKRGGAAVESLRRMRRTSDSCATGLNRSYEHQMKGGVICFTDNDPSVRSRARLRPSLSALRFRASWAARPRPR